MATTWLFASACIILIQSSYPLTLASSSAQNTTLHRFSFTNKTVQATPPTSTSLDPKSSRKATIDDHAPPSTAGKVGDFIAFGLGMSATEESPTDDKSKISISTITGHTTSASTLSPQSPQSHLDVLIASSHNNSSDLGTQLEHTKANDGTSKLPSFTELTSTNTGTTRTDANVTASKSSDERYNQTYTLSGDCWNQWNQYWSAEDSATQRYDILPYTTTFATTESNWWEISSTFLSTYTTIVYEGLHAITTYSTHGPETSIMLFGTPTTTWTTTQRASYWSAEPMISLMKPSCTLSDIEPRCQSSWDRWAEDPDPDDIPKCTQAKLKDSFCSSTIDHYIHWLEQSFGPQGEPMTLTTANPAGPEQGPVWNASMILGGPGCTLGCGYCAIQGETVELIYWPPATSLPNGTDKSVVSGASVVITMGTTFTSPTVYISFDKLWAQNSCSRFGRTISNAIVAITKTEDMLSLFGAGPRNGQQGTASFNFTDLYQDPVAESVYSSQPRCWSSYWAAMDYRAHPLPSGYSCAHTAPYNPLLVIPLEVRALDPEWAECKGGIRGVYDPPVALTPKNVIAVPTQFGANTGTSTVSPTSNPFSDPAPETRPAKASRTSHTSLPVQRVTEDVPHASTEEVPTATLKSTKGSGQNVWPLPRPNVNLPPRPDALSILESAQASLEQAGRWSTIGANHGSNSNDPGQSGDISASQQGPLDHVEPDPLDHAHGTDESHTWIDLIGNSPATHDPITAVRTYENEAFTVVVADGSDVIHGAGVVTIMATSAVDTFLGHLSNLPAESAEADPAILSLNPSDPVVESEEASDLATAAFTVSGHDVTAVLDGSSLLLEAAGTTIAMSHGAKGNFAGQVVSMPKVGDSVINVNGEAVTLQPLDGKSTAVIPTSIFWTHNGDTLTAEMREDSAMMLIAASTTVRIPANSMVTIGDEAYSLQPDGVVLVHGGTRVTFERASQSTVSVGRSFAVVVLDGKTITLNNGAQTRLGDKTVSAASTGGAMIINGVTIPATRTRLAIAHSSSDVMSEATETSKPTSSGKKSNASANALSLHFLMAIALLGIVVILGM